MSQAIHIILNPASGAGRGTKRRPVLERALSRRSLDYTIRETAAPGHAVELAAEAIGAGATVVAAAGGDGTVHEVANGLLQARPHAGPAARFAAIPMGTGNDFAAQMGASTMAAAIALLETGASRSIDVGRVEWDGRVEYFVNGAGTGIDVDIVRHSVRLKWLPGLAAYLASVLRAVARYRPPLVRIRLDGRRSEQELMILAVGNGNRIGGGFRITPHASMDDGWFDVCLVEPLNYLEVARVLPRVMRGTHTEHERVEMSRARSIHVETLGDEPFFFQLDGELRRSRTGALKMEIEPDALMVLAGPAAP